MDASGVVFIEQMFVVGFGQGSSASAALLESAAK